MIPHQRRTSPPRGVPRMPPQQPHPALHQAPPQQLGAPPQQQVGHPYPAPIGNEGYRGVDEGEVRRLQDELAHKEAVLKQLEVQFDLYKEEHAKLLASKIEEQREAFNVEKDRINQHFIRTGQELHAKTEELHQQIADNERLKTKNKNLTDWLDKGVEECKRVADENERLKQDLLYVSCNTNRQNNTRNTSKNTHPHAHPQGGQRCRSEVRRRHCPAFGPSGDGT